MGDMLAGVRLRKPSNATNAQSSTPMLPEGMRKPTSTAGPTPPSFQKGLYL
jgi:hypothetical protein